MHPAGSTPESNLLLTLAEISQLVAHSHDPQQTLGNIVRLIQGRFHSDVCSVYLLEPETSELVLGASVGLRPESIGRVRMRLDEGLTGLVAEQLTPVTVDDAFSHPRFKYFPEAGEDPYHSFLGVPLLECGALQGVLVVQTLEPRSFSANETRLLVTVAAQLASLVSGAQLLDRVVGAAHGEPLRGTHAEEPLRRLTGVSLSPGTGVGEAYLVNGFEEWRETVVRTGQDPALEARRLTAAMEGARAELLQLSQHISALVGQDHGAILQAQLMLMQDRTIEQDLATCLEAGMTAEAALLEMLDKYVAAFQKLSTPFWKERVYDVKDVFRRLLWQLRTHTSQAAGGDGRVVLVAHEASVMDLFSVDLERLAGVVVERGGTQSHAAILARSLGIPMVAQVADAVRQCSHTRAILVDGSAGLVHIDPSPALLAEQEPTVRRVTASCPDTVAVPSGLPRVEVNINLLCEVGEALAQRAPGVGLYRTEFLFLARRSFPTEEEQVGIYSKLLEQLGGRPVTIRTFDLRPDKLAHAGDWTAAAGPLDWRLVLESAPVQKLFKDQVRAILRAAVTGPARILVPLVTRNEHLDFILQIFEEAKSDLRREGLAFGAQVPLGIMIEVAGAALLADSWAERVDFFAIGTNDLAASALGIDRENPVGARRNDVLHPGVLRLIQTVVTAAHEAGRRVTVCGEMAADPEGSLALAALQVDGLSVPVQQFAGARRLLAELPGEEVASLAPRILRLTSGDAVREFLRQTPRPAPPLFAGTQVSADA